MPTHPLDRRIRQYVHGTSYRAVTSTKLMNALSDSNIDPHELEAAIERLRLRGELAIDSQDRVHATSATTQMTGVFRPTRRRFGFCIPDHPTPYGDLFIPPGKNGEALSGDHVLVRVLKRGKRGGQMKYEGRVVEILKRGRNHFVGRVQHSADTWFIVADGEALPGRIVIPDAKAAGARVGDQVVVQIVQYPNEVQDARGVVLEVLGPHGEPGIDALSILREFEIPDTFSAECQDQAAAAALNFDAAQAVDERQDLRELLVITIDPTDARDFDDAISVRRLEHTWELGVHIADVSHFIPRGSPLDIEAQCRGNSVYLPGHVVPMLPEALSNGVCSLQEGVDRLCKSAFIEYDDDGQVLGARFCDGVIRSSKRLTYEQATNVLEGRTGGFSEPIVTLLQDMERLARIIQARRIEQGMISLNLPDADLILDEFGAVQDVQPEDQSYSHTIIEMFMVEANEAVARHLDELKLLALRRVHPNPPPDAFQQLAGQLKVLGFSAPDPEDYRGLQQMLGQALEGPEAFNVHYAVLRSMEPAVYSPENLGHYALASRHYAHFTSPIRRYPDLTVHRTLEATLHGRQAERLDDHEAYHAALELGTQCSDTERRAEKAERELKLLKMLEFLEGQIGTDVRGVITGLIDAGFFVRLDRYLVEGLVRFDDLPQQPWEVLREAFCAVHLHSGRRITIGDVVKVRLSSIDRAARRLDLGLCEQITTRGRGLPKQQKSRDRSRRGKPKQQRDKRKGRRGRRR